MSIKLIKWLFAVTAFMFGTWPTWVAAQPAVEVVYRQRMKVETALAATSGSPTQMAWGPLGRLYVMCHDAGVVSYRYNQITGKLSSPIQAAPSARGIGLGFHGTTLYYSTLDGGLVKATDDDGDGIYGEVAQGESSIAIVRGIPVGDHSIDQIQIVGDTLFVGIGRRTINGRMGPLSGGGIDDYGGQGFFSGGQGVTWGDSAYNGTIAWIRDLNQVVDQADSANAFNIRPSSPATRGPGPAGYGPLLAGGRQADRPLGRDAQPVRPLRGRRRPSLLHQQLQPGDDPGRWDQRGRPSPRRGRRQPGRLGPRPAVRGGRRRRLRLRRRRLERRSPFLPVGASGGNRVRSITFDNLANPGIFPPYNPAQPVGLGPSASANGCAFFYAAGLPPDLQGNLFITRYNPSVTDAGTPPRTIRYADVVAVDVATGTVKRVATGFQNPIAALWDGGRRLLVADFATGQDQPGAIYALTVNP